MKYNQELLLEIKTQYGVCKVYRGKEETIQADLAFNLWNKDEIIISKGLCPADDFNTINNLNFKTSVEIIRKGESILTIDEMTLKLALKESVGCELASFNEDNIAIKMTNTGIDIDILGNDKWVYFDYDTRTFRKEDFERALVSSPYLSNLEAFEDKYKDLKITDAKQIENFLQHSFLRGARIESPEVFKLRLDDLKALELRHETDDEEFITIHDLFVIDLDFINNFCSYICKNYIANIYFDDKRVIDKVSPSLDDFEEISFYVAILKKAYNE